MDTEILEHYPNNRIKRNLPVYKTGGVYLFTVPFLWYLQRVPLDEYQYSPFLLERHLKNGGFGEIDIKITKGWHTSTAKMLGLYGG